MSEPYHIMTKPQLKALIQAMQATADKAGEMGDLKLQFQVQCKITELAFVLHPEWDRRAAVKAAPAKVRSRREAPEPEVEAPTKPEEDPTALAALSDEELERSLGR